jgi:hypothetical protein
MIAANLRHLPEDSQAAKVAVLQKTFCCERIEDGKVI